jgi:UDP-3-O-[3-hydroxymyristoyl] glucosamine N-acyltransferase
MNLFDILKYLNIDTTNFQDCKITKIDTLDNADKYSISFLANPKYKSILKKTKAKAVFVASNDIDDVPKETQAIICKDPYITIAKATKLFAKPIIDKNAQKPIIASSATIEENVHIGGDSYIGQNTTILANSYIGQRVSIGDNCIIYPNVSILNDTQIGDNCIIGAGAVIGSDGFGFAPNKDNNPIKIYHLGNVILKNNVEIGANTTIDKGVYGSTIIEDGTKLDNLIQIAHNVHIGQNNFFAAQSGIAGSSKIGDNNMFGAQSGISGHLDIGSNLIVYARGGVTKNLKSGGEYAGFPILPHRQWLKKEIAVNRLSKK